MSRLIVSISGIRGVVGEAFGPREAVRFGLAFGTYLKGGTVVLGRDTRPSGPMLRDALRAGLLAAGCRVVDLGVLSTPGVSAMIGHLGADGGAVVTASHNPAPYNGVKLLSAKGYGLSGREGEAVCGLFSGEAFAEVGTDGVGVSETICGAAEVHVERVLGVLDAASIRSAGFRVVLDSVNGAGGPEMVLLLERLGCQCLQINAEPTGRFGRPPEPTPQNLGDLERAVREHEAAIGLALDPDADRLSLVDETGRAIGEEYTLALAAKHRLSQAKGPVAANLSTSRMMDDVAREAGVVLHRTPVGEVNVAQAVEREGCLIGGEGNGGVIDPRVAPVRDALAGAGLILEQMAARRRCLSELSAELPVYKMVKDKVALGEEGAAAVLEAVEARFGDARVDRRDGLHLAWDDGWLHVRPSNTEPILRVIAEATDGQVAARRVRCVKAMAQGGT